MVVFLAGALGIEIPVFVVLQDQVVAAPFVIQLGFHPLAGRLEDGCLVMAGNAFGFLKDFLRGIQLEQVQIDVPHLHRGVPLVVLDIHFLQAVFVQQVLQVKQCRCFVAADVSQVVGALAADGHRVGLVVFQDRDAVGVVVSIALDAEGGGFQYRIVAQKVHAAGCEDAFSPADDFIRAVVIDIFEQQRQGHGAGMPRFGRGKQQK